MEMVKVVSKRYHFSAAHRLVNHKGLCKNLHGHRYEIEAVCAADKPDEVGCIVDFSEMNDTIGAWLNENLDHATLVASDDYALRNFCLQQGSKSFLFPNNTTCENMIEKIFVELQNELVNQRWELVGLVLYEGPHSRVTYGAV